MPASRLTPFLALLFCVSTFAAEPPPRLTIKPADLERARENVRRYEWARKYRDEVVKKADARVAQFTPAFVERMVEATTPLATIFTPCPACRDLGKNWFPHGQWQWNVTRPEELKCEMCGTVFPNPKYPETVIVRTKWGMPQTLSFVGGKTFQLFNYKDGRPSISGCIRARKVDFVTDACRDLAEAYLLTGDVKYASSVRVILLRFAKVYPHYLVHSGYGQFMDMDPRVAVTKISELHTGFWTAGRATGHGQESRFVKAVAFAYDATFGAGVYSEDEKRTIEKDLLRESTILLVADKQINNKSVGNRTAAAMVGLVLDDRELIDFGMEGFRKTTGEWFLPDGGTPESPAYALMALSNTIDMPLAFHELWKEPKYTAAWTMLVDSLQGDCTIVPYADAYARRKFDASWAELLVANYPTSPRYLALLKQLCGENLREAPAARAIYYREPGLESRAAAPLSLPSFCGPDQRIGFLRTGDDGRESLLVLSASRWGTHHHLDSLNLYYWKDGRELLTDLGYLWDNPQKSMTTRTLAHNTVLIDGKDQERDRGGDVEFFQASEHVKVMRGSSKAYEKAKQYERTSAIIDHGDGHSYVVDFFAVEGGKTQDYVFHGPHQNFTLQKATTRPSSKSLYDFTNVRTIETGKFWRVLWHMNDRGDDRADFVAWSLPREDETARIGDGWGQRDGYNSDRGKTIPYIVRRTRGGGTKRFVSVFESHPPNEPFVLAVKRSDTWGGNVKLEVETPEGRDYIECSASGLRVTSKRGEKVLWKFAIDE